MTGEVSIRGYVKPVGGIVAKVEAARLAGAKRVIIPKDNWQQAFQKYVDFQVIGVERFEEILALALIKTKGEKLTVPSYGKESVNPVAFAHNLQEISF